MKSKSGSVFRRGGWKMLVCAALLVLCVAVSILFDALGPSVRIDMTRSGAFTLSESTRELLAGLQEEIYIYSVYGEERDMRLNELLARYAASSEKISAQLITAEQAAYFTTAELMDNSLIVTNGHYVDTIDYTELYTIGYETKDYYQTLTDYSLVAEDKINRAIAGVTADLPIAYMLSSHGELALEPGMEDILLEAGCHSAGLYLDEVEQIPQDCAMIICNAPQIDITEKEADMLIEYIDNGGAFFLVTDMQFGVGQNLRRVTEHAGLAFAPGIVVEGDIEYMFGSDYAYYLMPDHAAEHPLAPAAENETAPERVVIGLAHAIDLIDAEGYAPSSLLETSETAYIKPNAYLDGFIGYAEGDRLGPLTVAATSENEQGGRVFWLAGSQCLGDMIDEMSLGANYALASAAFGWLHEGELAALSEAVPPRSMLSPAVDMPNTGVFIAVSAALPLALLAAGVILCAKRHKADVHNRPE
ncbi:MAG: Gldg family protein [Eubacteriales bacterium]|nr:Gldg family protein [Eubacteriales bacterium]